MYKVVNGRIEQNVVTLDEVLACLPNAQVVHRPASVRKPFRRFEIVADGEPAPSTADERTIVVCRESTAKRIADDCPHQLLLVLAEKSPDVSGTSDDKKASGNGEDDWYREGGRKNRIAYVTCDAGLRECARLVSQEFLENMLWESDMDHIVFKNDRADRLCEASEGKLPGYLCVTDSGFNRILDMGSPSPDDEALVYLHANGCYDRAEIERLGSEVVGEARDGRSLVICESSDKTPRAVVMHYPIYVAGAYVFHIAYAPELPENADAELSLSAAIARFEKFCRRANELFVRYWREKFVVESPLHRLLIGFITGREQNPEFVQTQLSQTNIPGSRSFRLLCFGVDPVMAHDSGSSLVERARVLNEGAAYAFMYGAQLLVLTYSENDEGPANSIRGICRQALDEVCQPFNVPVGVSQQFTDIARLDYAYRQTCEALAYRDKFNQYYGRTSLPDGQALVVPFEFVIEFMLLDDDAPRDLIRYSLSHSALDQLAHMGAESGTDLVELLWVYLRNDCNARRAAELLYLHRNTVVYHVKKIEKRFDFSLNDPMVQSRIRLDYMQRMLSR